MKIFDLHQDLMTHVRFQAALGQTSQTGWSELAASDIDLVVATAFPFPPGDDHQHGLVPALITEEIDMYREYLSTHSDWQLVRCGRDLSSAKKKLLLHIEGLNVFDGSPQAWRQLEAWVQAGVRSVGTHWNIANQLGGGTLQPAEPLTETGHAVIEFLEANNLVFDLAHMGRKSFFDAVKITSRPLYVSHGNAAAQCDNLRNYTDEQLKLIADTDGVIGIFFAKNFVTKKHHSASIDDVVAHIQYVKNLIGIRHLAIGSDFGGIVTGGVVGLGTVKDVPNLFSALRKVGFSEEDIERLSYKNAERVLQAQLAE